jgi:hypothetical protein
MSERKIIDGVRLLDDHSITQNERAWLEFIRLAFNNSDPKPNLALVQLLRAEFLKTQK